MRALILALVLLFVGCGGGCGGMQRASGTQGIQYTPSLVKDSTFLLEITYLGQPAGSATIWKVKEGYGVTAGHVCMNASPGVEFFAITQANQRLLAHVLKTNDPSKGEDDVCVMTVDLPGVSLDRVAPVPEYGDPVFYSGAPQGVYFAGLQPGFVGMALNPGFMSIGWAQGASGGPVFTRNGIVGVLVAGFRNTDIARYVPVDKLVTFLKASK